MTRLNMPGQSNGSGDRGPDRLWRSCGCRTRTAPEARSLVLSWTTSLAQRAPDGQTVSRQLNFNRAIYVSSNGRLFQRATRSSGQMSGTSDLGPGDKAFSKTGEAAGMRFAGDRLVGNVAFATGAAQFTVSFGGGFSSCTVDVSLGREGGQMRRKGLDGRM